jgi:hypothetical protein
LRSALVTAAAVMICFAVSIFQLAPLGGAVVSLYNAPPAPVEHWRRSRTGQKLGIYSAAASRRDTLIEATDDSRLGAAPQTATQPASTSRSRFIRPVPKQISETRAQLERGDQFRHPPSATPVAPELRETPLRAIRPTSDGAESLTGFSAA